MTYSKVPYIKL